MIPQMKAEEIITPDMEKISSTDLLKISQKLHSGSKDKFAAQYKEAITKKIIPAYTKMGTFLEKEYLPKGRDTDGYNSLPNGNEIYSYYVKSWTTTKNPLRKSIKSDYSR
jgi:uncharacterized protein (DUF885 family)